MTAADVANVGGIVLAGGRSTRMGRSKADLPFGPELMLQRVARLLGEVVAPITVVGTPGQTLPETAEEVTVVRDAIANRGPLQGIAAGLDQLQGRCQAAVVCSCDVPLLRPAFVRRMIELSAGYEIAVPHVDGFHHSLAAVYRLTVLPHVQALLAADRLRPMFLFERVSTRIVTADELTDVDPELDSLRNCNRPEDYQAALDRAGLGTTGNGRD